MAWVPLTEKGLDRFDWKLTYPGMPAMAIDLRVLTMLMNATATSKLTVSSTAGERHRGILTNQLHGDGSIADTLQRRERISFRDKKTGQRLEGFDPHAQWYERYVLLNMTAMHRQQTEQGKDVRRPEVAARLFDRELRRALLGFGVEHHGLHLDIVSGMKAYQWWLLFDTIFGVAQDPEQLTRVITFLPLYLELIVQMGSTILNRVGNGPISSPRRLDLMVAAEPLHVLSLLICATLPGLIQPAENVTLQKKPEAKKLEVAEAEPSNSDDGEDSE